MTLCFSIEQTLLPRVRASSKRDAGDALDLECVVDLRVDAALLAIAEIDDLLRLAEIDAAGQFAHDQDVEALDEFRLQRGGGGERRVADRRAQIGEELHVLAQTQQTGLGAHLIGHASHFGPPTAPNSTASAAIAFCMSSSEIAWPCAS
jgi:hypothetical protein